MAKLELKKSTTVGEFSVAFHEAFGAQVRVYNGRSRTEDNEVLGDLGLTNEGTFECRANLTAGRFIERMESEFGLKVKVYTCDFWVAVLDGLTLECAGKVKKNAVKADMEDMVAYQRNTVEVAPVVSYSKIQIRYYGDGVNSRQDVNTRQNVIKKVTLTLPNRVKAFGEDFGYDAIQIGFNGDHIMLTGNGTTLLDNDINGESNEYVESIVDWEWIV
jgi:hypothetical protein